MQDSDEGNIFLEKMEKHVGAKFPSMFLDFNEFGPQGVVNIEYLKGLRSLFGEYSEFTPYLDRMIDAYESGILSTASIGGKMRNSVLVKKVMMYQRGDYNEMPEKKGFSLFGNNDNKDKDPQQQKMFG